MVSTKICFPYPKGLLGGLFWCIFVKVCIANRQRNEQEEEAAWKYQMSLQKRLLQAPEKVRRELLWLLAEINRELWSVEEIPALRVRCTRGYRLTRSFTSNTRTHHKRSESVTAFFSEWESSTTACILLVTQMKWGAGEAILLGRLIQNHPKW